MSLIIIYKNIIVFNFNETVFIHIFIPIVMASTATTSATLIVLQQ